MVEEIDFPNNVPVGAALSLRALKEILKEFEEDETLVSGNYYDAFGRRVNVYRGV